MISFTHSRLYKDIASKAFFTMSTLLMPLLENGTFLQQLECGYEFPALIHVWIASAGVLEWFISTSGEATSACKPF